MFLLCWHSQRQKSNRQKEQEKQQLTQQPLTQCPWQLCHYPPITMLCTDETVPYYPCMQGNNHFIQTVQHLHDASLPPLHFPATCIIIIIIIAHSRAGGECSQCLYLHKWQSVCRGQQQIYTALCYRPLWTEAQIAWQHTQQQTANCQPSARQTARAK